MNTFYP